MSCDSDHLSKGVNENGETKFWGQFFLIFWFVFKVLGANLGPHVG